MFFGDAQMNCGKMHQPAQACCFGTQVFILVYKPSGLAKAFGAIRTK